MQHTGTLPPTGTIGIILPASHVSPRRVPEGSGVAGVGLDSDGALVVASGDFALRIACSALDLAELANILIRASVELAARDPELGLAAIPPEGSA